MDDPNIRFWSMEMGVYDLLEYRKQLLFVYFSIAVLIHRPQELLDIIVSYVPRSSHVLEGVVNDALDLLGI